MKKIFSRNIAICMNKLESIFLFAARIIALAVAMAFIAGAVIEYDCGFVRRSLFLSFIALLMLAFRELLT